MFEKGYFFTLRCAVAVVVLRSRRAYESNADAFRRLEQSCRAEGKEYRDFQAKMATLLARLENHRVPTGEKEAAREARGVASTLADLLLARLHLEVESVDPKSPSLLVLLANFAELSEQDQMTVVRACAAATMELSEENLRTLLDRCLSLPPGRAKLRLGCAVNALSRHLPQPVHVETYERITTLMLSNDYCDMLIGANVARTVRMREGLGGLMKEKSSREPVSERATLCFKRLVASSAYWYL